MGRDHVLLLKRIKPTVVTIARRHARIAAAGMEIFRPRWPNACRR